MPVSVVSPRGRAGLAAPLRALVLAALALEGRRAGEVAVVLSDDARLRDLNRRWRGLDRVTDVLSFGYDDGAGDTVDGDVVVSLERAGAQATRFRVSEGRELARLVVHGALHLAGLDHQGAAERRRMRVREDRILRAGREAVTELDAALKPAPRAARRRGAARTR
jgi:probable rRNA maturation factor